MDNDKWGTIPNPLKPQEIPCIKCGKPSGWPTVLMMVIPPEGLKCRHCGAVVALPNRIICGGDDTFVSRKSKYRRWHK